VFNAANEIAVQAFLDKRIAFGRIPEVIERTLQAHAVQRGDSLDVLLEADRWARVQAEAACC